MYSAADFFDDMARFTQYRCHPELVEYVIQNSLDSLVWLRGQGVKFQASFGRPAFRVGGKAKFWSGLFYHNPNCTQYARSSEDPGRSSHQVYEGEKRMPYLELPPDFKLFYKIDDYTDPWTRPETILLVHGFPESTEAWRSWIPHLARQFRCISIDRRGFGQSGPVPKDFVYTDELWVDDLVRVINHLAGEPVHVIGGKSGGITVVKLAVMRPDLVKTITIASTPVVPTDMRGWLEHMDQHGMRSWARTTMPPRMGTRMPPRAVDWWVDLMGSNAVSTSHAYARWVSNIDIRPDLKHIRCPTLVISPGAEAPRRGRAYFEDYQKHIPDSELMVIPGDGYHPAATDPDACAMATFDFIRRRSQ